MKRKRISFYCTTLMLFCQVFLCAGALAIPGSQQSKIVEGCSSIKESLQQVQRDDAKIRTYLGRYFVNVLTRFVTPLNVRLLENNIINDGLQNSQVDFANARQKFTDDYTSYQQTLEELVNANCETEPEKFYDLLKIARMARKLVSQDVAKVKEVLNKHVELVKGQQASFLKTGENDE